MKVKTLHSEQKWQSPDGQKTIWAVTLDADGTKYQLQTFSEKIAAIGFEGDVESYTNARGDRFVKQPQIQGGYARGGNGADRAKADAAKQAEIRAEWSIGKAISSLGIFPLDDNALNKVQELAIKLNQMVDVVIANTNKPADS